MEVADFEVERMIETGLMFHSHPSNFSFGGRANL